MANHTLKLKDTEVLNQAREGLKAHLSLKADGYKCSTDDLLNLLLGVAVNQGTLEMLCNDLAIGLNAETVRVYLNEQLSGDKLPALEQSLNNALAAQLPQPIRKKAQQVAIDFHDRPYYGKQDQADGKWVHGPLRAGTHRFHRIASAYVIRSGLRVNLALHFVQPGESTLQILKGLLDRLEDLHIQISILYLDKGFDGIDEMNELERRKQPTIIACTIRGKSGGTKALCQGRKSYTTTYTFQGRGGKSCTTRLAVCRAFTTNKRTGRMKPRATWLIYILIQLEYGPKRAKRQYKRRFGIETSYRCSGQVRGWTTSPNPGYRFLLIGLAFYLMNVWIHLRWLYTRVARKGQPRLDESRFRLRRFAKFVLRALEQQYGTISEIVAPGSSFT